MTTTTYEATLQMMREELVTLELRAKKLRSAAKAVEMLTGTAPTRRGRISQDDSDVPAEFVDLNVTDRIRKVMVAEPERGWTLETLAGGTYTTNTNTLRSALHNLTRDGVIEKVGTGTWQAVARPAEMS